MNVRTVTPELMLIPLDMPERPGFRDFISTWLLRVNGQSVVVDPGPARTIPLLVKTLRSLGVNRLTGVILTHIHMDHAGGIGQLVQSMPVEWVLAHPKAHFHLSNPTRLWQGSQKVLGDLAEFYGPIQPIDAELIRYDESIPLGQGSLCVLQTPGHAPHHLSVMYGDYLFAGESMGVVSLLESQIYVRPATPPRFYPEVFFSSLQRLMDAKLPRYVCFGHFGWREDASLWAQRALEQTQRWMDMVQTMREQSVDTILERLLREDPWVAGFTQLEKDIQQRERYFLSNSIRGMLGFFRG